MKMQRIVVSGDVWLDGPCDLLAHAFDRARGALLRELAETQTDLAEGQFVIYVGWQPNDPPLEGHDV